MTRQERGGWRFAWYLRRWLRNEKRMGWKEWRAYNSHHTDFREALSGYRDYAHYWRTGEY